MDMIQSKITNGEIEKTSSVENPLTNFIYL